MEHIPTRKIKQSKNHEFETGIWKTEDTESYLYDSRRHN